MDYKRSVSQWALFVRCGEAYRLERVAKAPARPAAWFAQGVAVHHAIELWEESDRRMPDSGALSAYYDEYDVQIEAGLAREPDRSRWLTGGRVRPEDDIGRRRERGANQVRAYIAYSRQAPERPWRIGGVEPAVEVPFEIELGGVKVVGKIDEIVEWPDGQLTPRDWKTGSRRPDWPFQLGVYALAIEDLFDYRPLWGDFWMAKDGRPDAPIDLTRFTRERVARWFRDMDRAVSLGLFLPNPGDGCRTCGVSEFCSARGGRADEYPPRNEMETA